MSWFRLRPPRKPAPTLKPVAKPPPDVKASPLTPSPVNTVPAPAVQPPDNPEFKPLANGQSLNGFTAGHYGYRDPKADWPIRVHDDIVLYEVRQGDAGYPGDDGNNADRAELLSDRTFEPGKTFSAEWTWVLQTPERLLSTWYGVLHLHTIGLVRPQFTQALWVDRTTGQAWAYFPMYFGATGQAPRAGGELGGVENRVKVFPGQPIHWRLTWRTHETNGLYELVADGKLVGRLDGFTGFADVAAGPRMQRGIYRGRVPQTLRTLEEGFRVEAG